jgi:hypothetical protein
MSVRKFEKPSSTESSLLIERHPKPAEEILVAPGGISLVVRACSFSGVRAV